MKGLTALALLAALALSACATPPEPPLCRVVNPPQQWLDYCARNPSDPDC